MRSFIATALALAGAASAATNSTASGTAVGSIFAQGYDQSCQAYYTECSNESGRCQSGLDDCNAKCQTAYNSCRIGADANMATCAANYAGCLGKNPFDSNGSLTNGTSGTDAGAAAAAGGASVTTEVVTSFTTFCPFATQVTYNGQVYTVTSATVLTITNCPCTITKPVSAGTAVATGSVATSAKASATGSSGNGSTPYKPEAFTGAGSKGLVLAGSGLIAGVAGLAIFL